MFLTGENVRPHNNKEAKKLIGKEVEYVLKNRIDLARGWCSSVRSKIVDVQGKNIRTESDWIYIPDIYEMVIIKE